MNPEIKAKWTAALRSGEFKQGSNMLHSIDSDNPEQFKHCCLGVLCELHQRETGDGEWVFGRYVTGHNESSGVVLTPTVAKWAGLMTSYTKLMQGVNPDLTDGNEVHWASAWNDDHGATFDQIADMIDRSL